MGPTLPSRMALVFRTAEAFLIRGGGIAIDRGLSLQFTLRGLPQGHRINGDQLSDDIAPVHRNLPIIQPLGEHLPPLRIIENHGYLSGHPLSPKRDVDRTHHMREVDVGRTALQHPQKSPARLNFVSQPRP